MKKILLFVLTLVSLIVTSCADNECEYSGDVTITFERMPSPNPTVTMIFYVIDGEKIEILRDNLESLSYTTTLNFGNYSLYAYSPSNIFRKEIGFQITPGKNVKIAFDRDFNPSRVYE